MGTGKPKEQRAGLVNVLCTVCKKKVWRFRSQMRAIRKGVTCSKHCRGVLRARELMKHSHKGRAAWSLEAKARFSVRMSGASNPAWKGGVTIFRKHGNYAGVRYVRCPKEFLSMARKDGYVMEHRLFVAMAIGRCLMRVEIVHHGNRDPADNRLGNLMLFATNRDHKLFEHRGSPEPIWRGSSPSILKVSFGA
jgi:hypothetical protein